MSDSEEIAPIAKISGSERSVAANKYTPDEVRVTPDKEKFDAAMANGNAQVGKIDNGNVSLLDEVKQLNRKVESAASVDPQQLAMQSKDVINQIEQIKSRLSDPQSEIRDDYKRILRNKLEHIDENLKVALDKAGLPYVPLQPVEGENTPVQRFLSLLTGGQEQLKTLGGELQSYAAADTHISPANLLLVQLKVNYIQQEVEFFTGVLNKALESTKTIMNVQV